MKRRLIKFRHTVIRVAGLDKSLEFYTNVLGMSVLKTRSTVTRW
ncbi:TPA: VOC family protein [Vibrio parahaemolyticus]